jgi:hypothetical protein
MQSAHLEQCAPDVRIKVRRQPEPNAEQPSGGVPMANEGQGEERALASPAVVVTVDERQFGVVEVAPQPLQNGLLESRSNPHRQTSVQPDPSRERQGEQCGIRALAGGGLVGLRWRRGIVERPAAGAARWVAMLEGDAERVEIPAVGHAQALAAGCPRLRPDQARGWRRLVGDRDHCLAGGPP